MKRLDRLATAGVVAAILCASSAHAAIQMFDANLDGLQETPPIATPGNGLATLLLDDATGDFTLHGSYFSLIGTANNAHIHGSAPVGTPAGIVVGLSFSGGTTGTLSGAGTFSAAQMADLQAGLYYVNVHTTEHALGEIRGQLFVIPEPLSIVLLSLGGLYVLAFAWRRRKLAA